MRNLLIALFCVLFAVSAFAQDAVVEPAAAPVVAPAVSAEEFNGILEVTPADTEAGQTEATMVLDMGEKTFKLEVADAAKRTELEALAGKAIVVKGELVAAANAEELDVIKVASWEESEMVVDDEPVDEESTDLDAPDAE
ncbi:MAG: hypothetical protein CVV42_16150 [Candidatus Riflebacteria bacterium HGW-Riflebacteria-2]|jgi:hypothetical protein|nr:MAG: hypothetical protein CVV42_16150 [Candidatus Riflebacteria bacterium HGW-Riflebacteria-2]